MTSLEQALRWWDKYGPLSAFYKETIPEHHFKVLMKAGRIKRTSSELFRKTYKFMEVK